MARKSELNASERAQFMLRLVVNEDPGVGAAPWRFGAQPGCEHE